MKIIVTGALGHIGSLVVRRLPVSFPDAEIIMIDNLMTQRYCSLFNLPQNVKYHFVEGDVTKLNLENLFFNTDVVIHLAAVTDAAGSFDKADVVENNNFNSTKKVAEACLQTGTKLITFSSTSVYGTQNNLVDENCSEFELKPQSPYATTKLKEEKLVRSLFLEKNLKVAIFRFGTIVGVSPGIRFHTAVNKFCWQAAFGKPITVWKTAYDQMRPYLEINDACNTIIEFIKKDIFDGEIYNVLTTNATVRQIVENIQKYVPSLKVEFVDSPIMNQLSYEVNSKKIRDKINIEWSTDLSASIREELTLLNVIG
ncbi:MULTISPECIES: SDR family oxidoreductase [Leptospira]|uniref:NAD dependent epimerase/dehydratase family protein n=1 Tax=Leptospira borgpetersenii serovar Javanica str. UI 09931 TaxID=1049767 RepID=A0AAV3J7M3_LEPBO|nr:MULTISPECIES: SDR family oxidoreductase [Leptospira]EMO08136.1 NAD-binding protein [Leptospira borgpetersenii str. Noumea 25]EPG56495.1 NAD dependent epimerase/dehydratase family protein [Leptospira borgpetersenii serovar Javanica str. UI 09931]KGE24549.1 nucleoside-diphosphate sugar epimerase [Leptospira borgpetersenii serovar Ballum]MBE8159746.1 SDR family oxidoreductase [Leptospira borgpetersenii serovar Ballum]MBE8164232.1 SDR family oxidoreductase [Leptospira borgpetersenii serovar Bal